MSISQFPYKIQAPTLPTPILHREALIHLLASYIGQSDSSNATSTKLILLSAPAGYGKTTLLVDTITQISVPCCWYFLESSDTPGIFLRGLLGSVQQCFPEVGKHLDAALLESSTDVNEYSDMEEHCERILDLLIDILNREISQRFILTLCNYHKVKQNDTINRLVNRLLARPFQQGVLIIESRSLPNLKLAPLIARRQMFGLGSHKLRFTPQELYEMAHLQGFTTFSLQEAEYLVHSFEGWIAGILLGSSLGYTQMYPLTPSHKRNWGTHAQLVDRQQLFIYIINEIFSEEKAIYEFLEAVSILDQLTPERCNVLLEITDAAERLIYAEQQGLFVIRSEEAIDKDEVGVYICHPILRELLKEHLCSQSFERYLMLHRRAAHLLQNDLRDEQILMHALQAQEYSLAISIITQAAPHLVTQGYSETVDLWLDMLPKHIVEKDPWLLMLYANIHLARNEYAQVSPLLATVEILLETTLPEQTSSSFLLLQTEIKLARSKLLFYQGKFQHALELCQEALRLLPADSIHLRIRAHQRLGVCLTVGIGHIHEGIIQFQQALQLSASQNDEHQKATLHRLLASAYGWLGNYSLADYHQDRALFIWEKLHQPQGMINSLTSMGLLKLRQGFIQKAEEVLTKALHLAKEVYHFKSGEAYALIALGELYSNQNQYVQALSYLEDGLRLARQCEDRYLIHCGLCSIATTYLFMGEIQTSQFFLCQVMLQKQEEGTYEGLLRYLTQSRLFLAQKAYDQAQQNLEHAITLGEFTNIRFLHFQALLLLGLCYMKQQKMSDARQAIRKAIDLNKKGDFGYILEIELRCYPELPDLLISAASTTQATEEGSLSISKQAFPETQLPSTPTSEIAPKYEQDDTYKLRLLAFGEPKVFLNDIPITRWRMTRAQELFFFLLDSARPLSKDRLIDAIWPNTTSEQIDTMLRTAIYYLRQAIGKKSIIYVSGLYSLDLSALYGQEIWYDVTLFEAYYRKAKQALEERDDESASIALSEMVKLYTGDYLQPFYNNWCIFRRSQLRQAYMDAREQLALIAWRQECWKESIEQWHHLLSLDPCSEKAHYGIMCCYLRQGKRELALRQYQICCQCLQEELQTKPGSSIQKLYQRINQT